MDAGAAKRHLCILACCGVQLIAHSSQAAEWSARPSASITTVFNDNIALTTSPHPSVWGMLLSPDVKFTGATETLAVTGGINLSFDWYANQPALNTANYAVTLRSGYKATERDLLKLDIDATRDPTLVSELATTGLVLAYRQRDLFNVNPSWSRLLTERTAISLSYAYSAVNYNNEGGSGPIDYRYQVASAAVQSTLGERHLATLAAYYDSYETDPASYKADSYGFRASYAYAVSETIRGTLAAGFRQTHSTTTSQALICDGFIIFGGCLGTINVLTVTQVDNTSGWTFDALIEKRTETDILSGQFSQQIYPSGQGSLIQTDRLAILWSRQWSPTLAVSGRAAAYQTERVGTVVSGNTSRYYTIEPKLNWRLNEQWTLDARYSYSRQKYENSSTAATSNAVYVTLRYDWPRIAASR